MAFTFAGFSLWGFFVVSWRHSWTLRQPREETARPSQTQIPNKWRQDFFLGGGWISVQLSLPQTRSITLCWLQTLLGRDLLVNFLVPGLLTQAQCLNFGRAVLVCRCCCCCLGILYKHSSPTLPESNFCQAKCGLPKQTGDSFWLCSANTGRFRSRASQWCLTGSKSGFWESSWLPHLTAYWAGQGDKPGSKRLPFSLKGGKSTMKFQDP